MPSDRRGRFVASGSRSRALPWLAAAAAVLVAVVIALLVRSGGDGTCLRDLADRGAARGYSVLLLTLDTVRADHLGCYGSERAITPVLDGLARSGVRFEDAFTSVPLTLPAHATLLTGRYPPRHGVRDNGRYELPQDEVTLAERLRDEGYATAAVVGAFVLDARFGLDQGFDLYDFGVGRGGYRPEMPDYNERSADEVSDSAIAWLEAHAGGKKRRPFFLWVHYFDPHLPYRSPLQAQPSFAGRPYDAEISWVDRQLGRVLEALDRLGRGDDCLVVVVADHGEALGEHGEPTHGMLLYEPTVRVPLILVAPGVLPAGKVVDGELAGIADLRPTIEDLLGLAGDNGVPANGNDAGSSTVQMDGRSLLRDPGKSEPTVYLETWGPFHLAGWSPLTGARTRDAKLIRGPRVRLFDLREDPGERRNLHPTARIDLAELESRLDEMERSWNAAQPGDESETPAARELSDEETERLESLGYLQGLGGGHPDLPDPEAMLPIYRDALEAERLYAEGDWAGAAVLARSVLDQCGGCVQATRVLAFSHLRLGNPAEAVRILVEAVRRNPRPFLIRSLAQALILQGGYEEADAVLDQYAEIAPRDGRVEMLRGDIYARLDQPDRAIQCYREALRKDEPRVGIPARQKIEEMQAIPGVE